MFESWRSTRLRNLEISDKLIKQNTPSEDMDFSRFRKVFLEKNSVGCFKKRNEKLQPFKYQMHNHTLQAAAQHML
jgi:hypothetical protein